MDKQKYNLLLVDDEPNVLMALERHLRNYPFTLFKAKKGREAFKIANQNELDAAVIDINMPGMDGLSLLKKLRALNPSFPIVVLSGKADDKTIQRTIKAGATDFIEKPFNGQWIASQLLALIQGNHHETSTPERA